jgi:1,2-diacylglycerol 3-alpha-glucosyltransferase
MAKKVVWISSFLPRSCGIAFYSSDYISAIKKYSRKKGKKISFKIISHTDAKLSDYPIIDNKKDKGWPHKVLKIIKKEKPDLVHIQHEYGLYETYEDHNQRVLDLIDLIKGQGIPVVMTYHSVYEKLIPEFTHFMNESLKRLDAGILHEQYQKDALKNNIGWEPENVYVLPHGSREDVKINRQEIRAGLNYSKNDLIVGTAGLASERKGFRTLIRQWPKVVEKFPNAILALELKPESVPETRVYIDKVLEAILDSPVMKNIDFSVKNYSEMEFYKRLASFDVHILPYKSESQSGVLAHGFSVGAPAIVTDIEGLGAEIRNSNAGIAVRKRKNFWRAINKLLGDKRLRDKYSKNAINYVKTTSGWDIIARKTVEIYEKYW